jgi:peptidoglycan/LPS O-acetylase OafA/YrhL
MSGKRLMEYEALRGLSILLLLALHSEVFDPGIFGEALSNLAAFVATFLLGSFFFLAGFFTEASLCKPDANALRFIWSKFIRIYPPYWLALALFIFVLDYDLSRSALAVYVLNLQAIFAPAFIKSLLTLWYISMLVVFYILYGGMLMAIRSSLGLLIVSIAIFFLALWAHLVQGVFDPRFFQYYFMFLAGILFYRYEAVRMKIFEINIMLKILFAVVSVAILQSVLNLQFPKTHVYFILAAGFFILSWVLLWLTIFRTTLGRWSLWAWLSTASFFAYLIHRPLWRIIDEFFGLEKDLSTVMIHLIPGAILALILGYLLQRGYDRLLAGLRLK